MTFMSADRIAPDWTPRFAASVLGLFCLPMSHKKDGMLIWVKDLRMPKIHRVDFVMLWGSLMSTRHFHSILSRHVALKCQK